MHPRKPQADLFRLRLEQIMDMEHPLCRLSRQIDWPSFEKAFGQFYSPGVGRPGLPIRLLVGLHYLKHACGESDETVVNRWLENPYWQRFCGYSHFQHRFPLHPTALVKWRKRIGESGMEKLLEETIGCAKRMGAITHHDVAKVNVDTTVQEKAIAFPTDARLYQKMRIAPVREARKQGVELRQTYERVGKKALVMQGRYSHARQMKRAVRETRRLKTYLGRVIRDIGLFRKIYKSGIK
jgi:IS5 family transposase